MKKSNLFFDKRTNFVVLQNANNRTLCNYVTGNLMLWIILQVIF